MPGILEDEEDGDLVGHSEETWGRDAGAEPAILGHRVEEPDLGKLDCEVAQHYKGCAGPLLSSRRNFLRLDLVSAEVGDTVGDDLGERAAKVGDLV
jgi:hypothetical protein